MNKTKQQLEQELIDAQNQLEQLKATQEAVVDNANIGNTLLDEMNKLNNQKNVSTGGLPYKIIDDHRNVPLYTELNKVIGPMHPDNAKQTMQRFYAEGYPLFAQPRTQQQIEAYKQTDRYKKRQADRDKRKNQIDKKKPTVQLEKFAKIIAKETKRSVEDLNTVGEK